MKVRTAISSWLVVVVAACASDAEEPPSFDSSLGTVAIVVAADGFVRCDDRRIPLEAAVLELRQRTRPMTAEDLARFVVEVRIDPLASSDSTLAPAAQRHKQRLLDELYVMGVRQARSR